MKLTRTVANVLSSLVIAWMAIQAAVPPGKWSQAVSLVCSFVSAFLVNMGYNRTPNGNVLPDVVKKMVDTNQATQAAAGGAATSTTVVESASMNVDDEKK